jgi:hypothetical protein
MKVLVLERVSQIEETLAGFIRKQFPNAELVFIGNVEKEKPETIMTAMQKCDVIAAQSIFDDTTAFESMVFLYQSLKINKPVYLIDGLQNLSYNLNFRISKSARYILIDLLKNGLELYDVYYKILNLSSNDKESYFKKLEHRYDVVKMWYNEKESLIWDERPFYITERAGGKEHFKTEKLVKGNIFDKLSKKEMEVFNELLLEDAQRIEEQIEDLETDRYGFDDRDELLKEKQSWKKVLNKLGFFATH